MKCTYKVLDKKLLISPKGRPEIEFEIDDGWDTDTILYFQDADFVGIEHFTGEALHSMQQGAGRSLKIHQREIYPILMDQTTGWISLNDIVHTNDSLRPYQRLGNILKNNFVL